MRSRWVLALLAIAGIGTWPASPAAAQDAVEPPPHEPGRVPPPGPYLPGFDALDYHIAIAIPETGARIEATTTVRILVETSRQDTLRLDLVGLLVESVHVGVNDGTAAPVPFRQDDGRLRLPVPATARAGDTLRVAVRYGGTPDDGLIIGENLHGQRGAFADNWPDRARFWFPAIDHPSDKATVAFEVHAPAGWRVIANGRYRSADGATFSGPIPPAPPDGIWRFAIDRPLPTYLMVIGAAPLETGVLDRCAGEFNCVPVTWYAYPPDTAAAAQFFDRADDMLAYYTDLIAPFPYEGGLAHVQSATRFGGMENATAIFYSERAVARGGTNDGVVAHETAHQWFGDAVTPLRWADLWLSEGFATYFGALFYEHAEGDAAFRERVAGIMRQVVRSGVTGYPVVDSLRVPRGNLLALLNANSYQKGAAVLHMLRGQLGDDAFFEGVRRYYRRHEHGSARTEDLRRVLEEVSGRDLETFFDQWLFRPGHPILYPTHRWDPANGEVEVTIEQVQPLAWPVFTTPIELAFDTPSGEVRRHGELNGRRTVLRFPLPAAPMAMRLDPDGWLLKEIAPQPEG